MISRSWLRKLAQGQTSRSRQLTRHFFPFDFGKECLFALHQELFDAEIALGIVGRQVLQSLHK
jgi:hypothetical protein